MAVAGRCVALQQAAKSTYWQQLPFLAGASSLHLSIFYGFFFSVGTQYNFECLVIAFCIAELRHRFIRDQ